MARGHTTQKQKLDNRLIAAVRRDIEVFTREQGKYDEDGKRKAQLAILSRLPGMSERKSEAVLNGFGSLKELLSTPLPIFVRTYGNYVGVGPTAVRTIASLINGKLESRPLSRVAPKLGEVLDKALIDDARGQISAFLAERHKYSDERQTQLQILLLSSLPNISNKTATHILLGRSIEQILSTPVESLIKRFAWSPKVAYTLASLAKGDLADEEFVSESINSAAESIHGSALQEIGKAERMLQEAGVQEKSIAPLAAAVRRLSMQKISQIK